MTETNQTGVFVAHAIREAIDTGKRITKLARLSPTFGPDIEPQRV